MRELLSTGQAARALDISRTTVRDAMKRGSLRCAATTRGGHARIDAGEVERYRAAMAEARVRSSNPVHDFRAVLDAFADPMIAADCSNRIVYLNPPAQELLGWRVEALTGCPLTAVMPARFHDQHGAGFQRFLTTRLLAAGGRALCVTALHRDGTEIDIELTLTVFPSAPGETVVVASLRDLRSRIELERQISMMRFMKATNQATARLASLLDVQQVMAIVVQTLVDDFDAALARVWLRDSATGMLCLGASGGDAAPLNAVSQYEIATSPSPLAHVARTSEALVVSGRDSLMSFEPEWASQWAGREGIVFAAIIPLGTATDMRGVMSFYTRRPLHDEVAEVLATFAAIVTASLRDVEQLTRAQEACAEAEASAAEAAAHARRLALVQQTARSLAVITSVHELCERLVDAMYECMGRHLASVYLRDGDILRLEACRFLKHTAGIWATELALGEGIIGHVAAANQPYVCHDTATDPHFHRPSDLGSRSEIAVPVYDGAHLVGVVNVESPVPHAFDDGDVATLAAIADQAAMAIQNARLYQAEAGLRRRAELRARRIEQVQQVGERLKMDLSEREIGTRVVEAAREALGFKMAVLNLVDRPGEPTSLVRVVATAGLPAEGEAALMAFDFTIAGVEALFQPLFRLSRSYFIPAELGGIGAAGAAGDEIPVWTPSLKNEGANAWQAGDELLVPLTDHEGGHLLGFLSVDDPESGQRPEHEVVEVLEIFADQAVVALRNARLHAQARRQAERDPVTELLNHRAAHARLEAELSSARADGRPLGLLTLDMDGFKLLNDTHGHPVGDMVLRHIAGLLEQCARTSDSAARLGGDEFLLILPGASHDESIAVAQRLSGLAYDVGLDVEGTGPLPLRLSIGIATFPRDAEQAQGLLAIADARLYEAKRAGGWAVEAGREHQDGTGLQGEADLAGFDMLSALVTAVDKKDRYTREHSEQVAAFACNLAEALGLSLDTQRTLRLAGLLHDVGKIGVPDRVLRKPGKLDSDEWDAMRQHVALSTTLVQAVVADPDVLAAVAHHHERWDGCGYPYSLAGSDVPLLGRIMIVADAVSAMAMDRPYRRGLSRDVIIAELRRGMGTQFDPMLVEPFIATFTLAHDAVA